MNKLNLLSSWAGNKEYHSLKSAQGYLISNKTMFASSGCGSGCGSAEEKPKPTACGAGDDDQPKPSSCGAGDDNPPKPSACGAGDDNPPKPSACGSSCGSGENWLLPESLQAALPSGIFQFFSLKQNHGILCFSVAHHRQLRPALPALLYLFWKQPFQTERDVVERNWISF